MPVYFFNIVGGLRDKSAKGYPVKKLLFVLWKSILACCGGVRDLARVKKLARELAGLTPVPDENIPIKSSPLDIEAFHQETSVKFPTFSAPVVHDKTVPHQFNVPTAKLADAYSPIPVRHHYNHDDPDLNHSMSNQLHSFQYQNQSNSGFRPIPQPATPAPSPSSSPKPKKQQFQTDPLRPFLFPFSRTRGLSGEMMLVPHAVEEADMLYHKHMYISLALWQMWKTREECMTADSGLERLPGVAEVGDMLSKQNLNANVRGSELPSDFHISHFQ